MIWHEEEVGKHQPNALFLIYPSIQRMNHRQKTFFEIKIFEWNDQFAHITCYPAMMKIWPIHSVLFTL